MSKIFGGSKTKQSSETKNLAYPEVSKQFLPGASSAFQAGTAGLTAELAGGFDAYRANSGVPFWKRLGLQKKAGEYSGRGLYNSGATLKALAGYENDIETAAYNDYLQQQAQLANLGIAGVNPVVGAGGYTKQDSVTTSTPGLGGFVGSILSSGALKPGGALTKLIK